MWRNRETLVDEGDPIWRIIQDRGPFQSWRNFHFLWRHLLNNQIIQYLGRLSSVALVPWCWKSIFVFCFWLQVFIGLGFPYEGPAPLEAIAQGCIFLNAKVTR